jgi:hypothetical protein
MFESKHNLKQLRINNEQLIIKENDFSLLIVHY